MSDEGIFPFGQKVERVHQEDKSPKQVFVLGVYASAVHARWLGPDGKQRVAALAVASEPEIFWRGEDPERIISAIRVPVPIGKLLPAGKRFNGPSGRSLDDRFLMPLGIDRRDVWLCDIYPYAMFNRSQLRAIDREYASRASKLNLPKATLESAPTLGPGSARVHEILAEIKESRAKVMILLGDRPIQWFLRSFWDKCRRLSHFGKSSAEYGQLHSVDLEGHQVEVLPVVHPRQASRLGRSSETWGQIHDEWVKDRAASIL